MKDVCKTCVYEDVCAKATDNMDRCSDHKSKSINDVMDIEI